MPEKLQYQHEEVAGVRLEIASFSKNGADELHLIARPLATESFAIQISRIVRAQEACLQTRGIPEGALVFSRYFVSDHANQTEALELIRASSRAPSRPVAVSIVQQPPLGGNKVEAWFYVIHDRNRATPPPRALSDHDLLAVRGGYRHLWSARLLADDEAATSWDQTDRLLRAYNGLLERNGLVFRDDCIRTWFFVKDIDFNYRGVVDARTRFFKELGLTAETHFVTSTGIEGRHADPKKSVLLDAYSVGGLAPGQIRFLEARDHLNPTHEYGVTFERGTSVDYGDRRHVFISGTASIDNKGAILHVHDVRMQTARALENIAALLADADATMADVAHLIVYLRDIADTAAVREQVEAHHPDIPKVFVWAPVCRPGWLVEIECMAVKSAANPAYGDF